MTNVHFATLFDTPPKARLDAEDYIASPQSANKSDLIEGVFVVASPTSLIHAQLQGFLFATLDLYVSIRNLGIVLGETSAYRLNADNVYQPDISFLSRDRLHLAGDIYVDGPPDLAVEIISPSSRRFDLVEKRINYARSGVPEYWVVDPVEQSVTVSELVLGEWISLQPTDGILRSKVLEGFWLRLDWLFPRAGQVRPNRIEIARQQGLI